MSIKNIILGCLLSFGAISASAQNGQGQAVQIIPLQVTTIESGSTITVTNTFQQVFSQFVTVPGQTQGRGRSACLIQNNGTHIMYVFFGPIANATLTNSFQIAAAGTISCQITSNVVSQDQISITGTSGDAYVSMQQ